MISTQIKKKRKKPELTILVGKAVAVNVAINQNIVYLEKEVDTLVIGKLLQTVVDNSGPKTETYETDRALSLQGFTERREMQNSERRQIILYDQGAI